MQILKLAIPFCCAVWMGACTSTSNLLDNANQAQNKRIEGCKVDAAIQRNPIPKTPNDMSLPSFGQGVIGWATGPDGAKTRLENVAKPDIVIFKQKGVTLAMVQEWQAFYENEVKRNSCNPTAPYRAALMKKIAMLWE